MVDFSITCAQQVFPEINCFSRFSTLADAGTKSRAFTSVIYTGTPAPANADAGELLRQVLVRLLPRH